MNSENSYKSKLRAFSHLPASNDEMKYSEKPTMKFEKMENLKTPSQKKSHSKKSNPRKSSPPPAPRANRSILETTKNDSATTSQNNNNNNDATPKRKSQKRTRLSEAPPPPPLPPSKKRASILFRTKSTQTPDEATQNTTLAAQNFALSLTIVQKDDEIRKIKRTTQNFVDNLRRMTQNFSFNNQN